MYNIKIGYIGGVRSGKSSLAEKKILSLCKRTVKPLYLATAKIIDSEMETRIKLHKKRRKDKFLTKEEPLKIEKVIKETDNENPILIESVNMWLNNMLYEKKDGRLILDIMERILKTDKTLVFVKESVGHGIMPPNKLAREFIDLSGEIDLLFGKYCQEVYLCFAGQALRLKPN